MRLSVSPSLRLSVTKNRYCIPAFPAVATAGLCKQLMEQGSGLSGASGPA
jgi:hypothetical protein